MRRISAFVGILSLVAVAPAVAGGRATILFFNDAHQLSPVVDRFGERGGVARLATLVRSVRREQPATLAVFGGDLAGGTLFGGQFKGAPQVEAFNLLGLDVAAFGQHDFDFGAANARALVAASQFSWLATNLDAPGGRPFAGLPRTLVREVGGLRIAFLGLTDDMATTTADSAVTQVEVIAAARAALAGLDRGKLDAVIALAQVGAATGERLLRELPGIDAVLAEEQAEDRTVVTWIGNRPIAAPAGNLGSVVRLDLESTAAGLAIALRALPVDMAWPSDPALRALAATYDERLDAALAAPVAKLATALPVEGARAAESRLGSLVADAWRSACGAEIGLMQSGGLRAGLPAGTLRRRELAAVLPFGNRVVCVRLTGAALRAALEHGVAGIERQLGTLLQVSGLRYDVDLSRPVGDRVRAVSVGGRTLDGARLYSVAMPSFLAAGGDGFSTLEARPSPGNGPEARRLDGDVRLDLAVLEEYLVRVGGNNPVPAPETGRISILGVR